MITITVTTDDSTMFSTIQAHAEAYKSTNSTTAVMVNTASMTPPTTASFTVTKGES